MFSKKFYFGARLQGHITTHTSDNTLKKKFVSPFVLHFLAVFERKKEKKKSVINHWLSSQYNIFYFKNSLE